MIFTDLFISGSEIFIILFAVLLLFGANKLPEIARGLGKGMNEFKKATNDIKSEFDEHTQGIQKDIKSIKSDLEESTRFDDMADNYFRDDDSTQNETDSDSDTATDTQTESDSETTEEDIYEEPSGPYSGNEENAGESTGEQEETEETEETDAYKQQDNASEQEDYPENEDQTGEGSSRRDASSNKENQ